MHIAHRVWHFVSIAIIAVISGFPKSQKYITIFDVVIDVYLLVIFLYILFSTININTKSHIPCIRVYMSRCAVCVLHCIVLYCFVLYTIPQIQNTTKDRAREGESERINDFMFYSYPVTDVMKGKKQIHFRYSVG